jgi:prevent-host-death family protein
MNEVTVRELRNYGGQVLTRVEAGEAMTVTRDGTPVARLTPLPQPRLNARALLDRWRNVPALDARSLREDLAAVMDLDL